MSLKPTLRRSGQMWATIQVTHHISRGAMLDLLVTEFLEERVNRTPTKAEVEKAVRTYWESHGGEADISVGDDFNDMVDEDEREEARDWAEELLTRLWPEWTS